MNDNCVKQNEDCKHRGVNGSTCNASKADQHGCLVERVAELERAKSAANAKRESMVAERDRLLLAWSNRGTQRDNLYRALKALVKRTDTIHDCVCDDGDGQTDVWQSDELKQLNRKAREALATVGVGEVAP